MNLQEEAFRATHGDLWYERNKNILGDEDRVTDAMIDYGRIRPTSVLEIGCSNGWRLKKLRDMYGCKVAGIDPSKAAIAEATYNCVEEDGVFMVGAAQKLPFHDVSFDLVIFGFCLSMIDPEDYFLVLNEANRVLKDGGYLIVHDLLPPRPTRADYTYASHDGQPLSIYMVDWAKFIGSHPGYLVVFEKAVVMELESVTIFVKSMKGLRELGK